MRIEAQISEADVGGVADVVDDGVNGWLAPMDDDAALARHVLAVLADPAQARSMGHQGRAKVAATYDSGRLVRDIEGLYEGLVLQKARL